MLEATIYLNDKPKGDVSDDMMGGFKDRLEDRAIQTSPAMQYFNNYKKQQVVEEVDEQEELIPSLIGKTVREPEVDALTQIYALDPQEPVVQPVQEQEDAGWLLEGYRELPDWMQKLTAPAAHQLMVDSSLENPITKGAITGIEDGFNGLMGAFADVANTGIEYYGGEAFDPIQIPDLIKQNPESIAEPAVAAITQFMGIFGLFGGMKTGANIWKMANAELAALATFDPTGENLAAILKEFDIGGEMMEYLAQPAGEDASAFERLTSRIKTVYAEAPLAFIGPAFVALIRGVKNAGYGDTLKEFMQSSDPELIPKTLQKFGIDIPKKDVVGDDYRMSHTAPSIEDPSLDDVTELFGDDIYGPQGARYYGHSGGDAADHKVVNIIKDMKGNPDAEVTIYRAVPEGVDKINEGDWVTIDKDYAIQHGKHATDPSKDMPVIEMKVKAKDLNTDGNSIFEWGYNPSAKQASKDIPGSATTKLRDELRQGGYKIDMDEGVSGEIKLSRIEVPPNVRGKGLGSKAMDQIIEMADKEGKVITLTPDTAFGGSSVARLNKFYKRFGFVENKGKHKDFLYRDSMLRLPKAIKKEPLVVYRSSTSGSYDKFDPSKQRTATLGKGVYLFKDEASANKWVGGNLQKIELPGDFMDKSINWGDGGQSDFVTKAFKNIEKEVDFPLDLEDGGIDVYPELVKNLDEDEAQALLLKHGIKGNRREGELTVFNVDDAKIISTEPKGSKPAKPATSAWHETNEEFGDYKIGTNQDSDLGLHFGTKEQGKARMDMIEGQIEAGHRTPPKNPVNSPKGRRMILNRLDIQNPLKLYENEAGSWDIPSVTRRIFEIEELPKGFSEADRKAWDAGTLSEKVTMDGKQVSVPVMPRVKPTSAEFSAISQGKAKRVVTDANRYVKDLTVAQQTEWMDNFLKNRGYDAIEYENIYEGGGTSHAVFNLDKIKQVDSVRYAALVAPTGALTTQDSDANELSDFIKGYEKYKGQGYYATKEEESEGLVTAGYGSTRRVKHGEKVTKEQAEKWLKEDIKKAHTTVDRLVKIKLNNNQKNALVSLVYNVGEGNFKKSKALKALNSGDIETFLKEAFDPKIGFVKAKKGGRILKGLVNRRSAEKELFIKGTK